MPTSVLIAVALSVLLGIPVFFTVPRDTEASASTAADHVRINTETVAGGPAGSRNRDAALRTDLRDHGGEVAPEG
jgi:hypothetical protein